MHRAAADPHAKDRPESKEEERCRSPRQWARSPVAFRTTTCLRDAVLGTVGFRLRRRRCRLCDHERLGVRCTTQAGSGRGKKPEARTTRSASLSDPERGCRRRAGRRSDHPPGRVLRHREWGPRSGDRRPDGMLVRIGWLSWLIRATRTAIGLVEILPQESGAGWCRQRRQPISTRTTSQDIDTTVSARVRPPRWAPGLQIGHDNVTDRRRQYILMEEEADQRLKPPDRRRARSTGSPSAGSTG